MRTITYDINDTTSATVKRYNMPVYGDQVVSTPILYKATKSINNTSMNHREILETNTRKLVNEIISARDFTEAHYKITFRVDAYVSATSYESFKRESYMFHSPRPIFQSIYNINAIVDYVTNLFSYDPMGTAYVEQNKEVSYDKLHNQNYSMDVININSVSISINLLEKTYINSYKYFDNQKYGPYCIRKIWIPRNNEDEDCFTWCLAYFHKRILEGIQDNSPLPATFRFNKTMNCIGKEYTLIHNLLKENNLEKSFNDYDYFDKVDRLLRKTFNYSLSIYEHVDKEFPKKIFFPYGDIKNTKKINIILFPTSEENISHACYVYNKKLMLSSITAKKNKNSSKAHICSRCDDVFRNEDTYNTHINSCETVHDYKQMNTTISDDIEKKFQAFYMKSPHLFNITYDIETRYDLYKQLYCHSLGYKLNVFNPEENMKYIPKEMLPLFDYQLISYIDYENPAKEFMNRLTYIRQAVHFLLNRYAVNSDYASRYNESKYIVNDRVCCHFCNKNLSTLDYKVDEDDEEDTITEVRESLTSSPYSKLFNITIPTDAKVSKTKLKSKYVVHHSHFSNEVIGPACHKCNIGESVSKVLTIFAHNHNFDLTFLLPYMLSSGDVEAADDEENSISIIAKNINKYSRIVLNKKPGVVKVQFLDSMAFLASSLASVYSSISKNEKIYSKGIDCKQFFPYDYINHEYQTRFQETSLPLHEHFYNNLTRKNIPMEEYNKLEQRWVDKKYKNLLEFSNDYLKEDVLMLTDIINHTQMKLLKMYEIDPFYSVGLPAFSYHSSLLYASKKDKKLFQPATIEDYNFFQNNIRGGLSFAPVKYAKEDEDHFNIYGDATNLYGLSMGEKLMNKVYGTLVPLSKMKKVEKEYKEEINSIKELLKEEAENKSERRRSEDTPKYIKKNNTENQLERRKKEFQYKLDNHRYCVDNNQILNKSSDELLEFLQNKRDNGLCYIFEVDISYPEDNRHFNNLPPIITKKSIPENRLSNHQKRNRKNRARFNAGRNNSSMSINTKDSDIKLIASLEDEKNYVCHYKNLQFYLEQGLTVDKIHKVYVGSEDRILSDFIAYNTYMRSKSTNKFEQLLYKLMNNSRYGKCLQRVDNYCHIKIVNEKEARKLQKKHHHKKTELINQKEYLEEEVAPIYAISSSSKNIILDQSIQVGFCVLELSKLHMLKTFYEDLPDTIAEKQLLYMDTDSFILRIKKNDKIQNKEDYFREINNHKLIFDLTKIYPPGHPLHEQSLPIKGKVGAFTYELAADENITEFVGLKSKLYSYKINNMTTGEIDEKSKGKGVSEAVMKAYKFDDYKAVLDNDTVIESDTFTKIETKNQQKVYSDMTKIVFTNDDEKAYFYKSEGIIKHRCWGYRYRKSDGTIKQY